MTDYYIDGAGWNGERSAYCVTTRDEFNQFNEWNRVYIAEFQMTNNEAEYFALIEALKFARDGDRIFTDSELVVGQVLKGWKINFEHLRRLNVFVKKILSPNIQIIWIPRESNYAGKLLER